MRFTIERLRTLVLATGILLIVVLVALLVVGKWRNPFNKHDIPRRLGIDIQEEASGFTYAQSRGGHTLFRIHASKVFQLKKGKAMLHDVRIELYGEDGSRVDRIEGAEFEYDQQAGIARATGPVDITLTRAGAAMAVATDAAEKGADASDGGKKRLTAAAHTASRGEIHVKTSGLTFDQNSGVASTVERVEFSLAQGAGSAQGASFDSQQARLVLEHAVDLRFSRGSQPVHLTAQHAEFERDEQLCKLSGATVDYNGDKVEAEDAKLQFREDGSAEELDATNRFSLTTMNGGSVAAPKGVMTFDGDNRPHTGRLEGGVVFSSERKGRTMHGTSPTMDLKFAHNGSLESAHLERGVSIESEEEPATGQSVRTRREWKSPVVDLAFHDAGEGHVELTSIRGAGGVTVNGVTERGNEVLPSHFRADDVVGTFGRDSSLTGLIGVGHAAMEQTSSNGSHQMTSGDRLEAHFIPNGGSGTGSRKPSAHSEGQIASARVAGHVVIVQTDAAGASGGEPQALRATAERADYEGAGQLLHLEGNPHIENGDLQLNADRIDISQATNDAQAHGHVKATWLSSSITGSRRGGSAAQNQANGVFGGEGATHAIADVAELKQKDGVATLLGNARLWQQANSIEAPEIVLNRTRQTLDARTGSASDPVRLVLLSAGQPVASERSRSGAALEVVRLRGGVLKYSAAERKAWMYGGIPGKVEARTAEATMIANEAELELLPPGNHAGKGGGEAQVDGLTARGNVEVSSRGRRGTGEQLVYKGESGQFVLTGTATAPPRIVDPMRGTVTGQTLIFNSGDDSVSIEGGARRTDTETSPPRRKRKHD